MTVTKTVFIVTSNNSVFRNPITCVVAQYFLGKEVSTSDATLVDKLRSAGAIIIGITNMHELGIGTLGNNPNRQGSTSANW